MELIKLSAECIPCCSTWLTQVRSVVGAHQPQLNPTGPCGQGQGKVMEWAGRGGHGTGWSQVGFGGHLGKEKFPSEAGERPRPVKTVKKGEEAC